MPPKSSKLSKRSRNSKKDLGYPLSVLVLQLLINAIFLGYVLHLENKSGCQCSATNELMFVKYWLMFVLVVLILFFMMDRAGVQLPQVLTALLFLVLVLGNLYYLYCVLVFVREMRESECYCSDTMIRSVMEVFALFAVLNLLFGFLTFIVNARS